jgi:mono/diheme cytochrome c family protein
MSFARLLWLTTLGPCLAVAQANLSPEQIDRGPAPAAQAIDFARDIQPIFKAACVKCHGKGKDKGGFSLETRETFSRGGASGPPVVAGQSEKSLLIELVSGFDEKRVMPQKGSRLKPEQIALLRSWIDQGAKWPATIRFEKAPVPNLTPHRPELPGSNSAAHPIDRFIDPYFANHGIKPAPAVEDRLFVRRVYLDVIGVLPTPGEWQSFLDDGAPDKRARLVKRLLADDQRYAEHWLTFWNDLLRNDYKGTGYIDDGRKQITGWLFEALLENRPYDQFVAQLTHPGGEAGGFINGIIWRGAVSASQTPAMQAAQNISQVFMGVNLKCASCHDSFVNDYTLADAYGLAGIYATNALEMFECDKPTGRKAQVKFLYSELGQIDAGLPRHEQARRLAQILTSKENGRFTRTIVNRLWARFLGRGLVEPVDEMDQAAWHPDLLDWLAEDFAASGYDLKHTMERILTSRAYALRSVEEAHPTGGPFVFAGPPVRRMTAEQFTDALSAVSGIWKPAPDSEIEFLPDFTDTPAHRPERKLLPSRAKWIWADVPEEGLVAATNVFLRRTVLLPEIPEEATIVCASSASIDLFVNGKAVRLKRQDQRKIHLVDVRPYLVQGENLFAVRASHNFKKQAVVAQLVGVWIDGRLRGTKGPHGGALRRDFFSDANWNVSTERSDGWERLEFKKVWSWAFEIPRASSWHESIERQLRTPLALATRFGHVRAALVRADSLTTALGRPNREQVTTVRPGTATTLQALELTNGETLNHLLQRGAEKLLSDKPSADKLIRVLFSKALGREPTVDELKLALESIGSPAQPEGVEDLLWSLVMLPEFQLIY